MSASESQSARTRRRPMSRTVTVLFAAFSLSLAWSSGPAVALDAGARLPEIGLKDMRGAPVDVASLKGKVVIVDFLASWCAPCKVELPVLERLYKKYKDRGLVVVGVSVDEDLGNLKALLKDIPVSFSVVHDADHKVAGRYKPPRMPSSYVADRNGVVRHVHGGFREGDEKKLEAEVVALLGK
jgi:cytochrome c biogenesis protein CcmG, thiol:disulfide interchange protein DsbE